jgi:hypothetical protein
MRSGQAYRTAGADIGSRAFLQAAGKLAVAAFDSNAPVQSARDLYIESGIERDIWGSQSASRRTTRFDLSSTALSILRRAV